MTRRELVLFVSNAEQNCGVYQFGLHISNALRASELYDFRYVECSHEGGLRTALQRSAPSAIIYNHHPATMRWLTRRVLLGSPDVPQLGIIHEVTQELADRVDNRFFDYYLAADPTLELRNPIVFKTGRLVPQYHRADHAMPAIPTIGSFGFGTAGKGFDELVDRVQSEFDEAVLRLHIPFSAYSDRDGDSAKTLAERCRRSIVKPGIRLELSHEFLTNDQLLAFLAGNSLNAFLYAQQKGRGISSVIDFALAVRRPIAVSRSSMFRHIHGAIPSVVVDDTSLRDIMKNGFAPLARYADAWTAENLVLDYERIIMSVLHSHAAARKRSAIGWAAHGARRRAESAVLDAQHWLTTSPRAQGVRAIIKSHPGLSTPIRALRSRVLRRLSSPARA